MKFIAFSLFLVAISSVSAFQVVPTTTTTSTALYASRRDVIRQATTGLVVVAAAVAVTPQVASAAVRGENYVPQFNDLKMIYQLGTSLDNLSSKLSKPETTESGLEGVRMFNRDPNFYTGYAKNFISKSVLRRADEDVRVGYIRSATTLIGSIESLLGGAAGLVEGDASKEAVKRVQKAQGYIGKFLAESGVEGNDDINAFVKKHPL